jgi:3-deoxy-D-manno-octulosonate 8-phosphate phosphatase KdsC-like HAD superfamily phosphatase
VAYLQRKHGLTANECACLFDDDNDLPMAEQCGTHMLPALTSASVRAAAAANPGWAVSSRAGQGVFAVEECLATLLERARREKAAEETAALDTDLANRVTQVLPLVLQDKEAELGSGSTRSA